MFFFSSFACKGLIRILETGPNASYYAFINGLSRHYMLCNRDGTVS